MATIRWGIIGCGDVTEVKSGPALQKAAGSQLVAVMRRDAEKAEDYARRHGVPRWYADADALIADPDVDAVYIATPPSSHARFTVAAAQAGKPVLVEKPMATSVAECERMIAACEQAGVPLFVAYYRRALPRFEAMRHIVQSGRIGAPRAVAIRHFLPEGRMPDQAWKVDPAVNGGGLFVDMQSHTLDWLDHVFGPACDAGGVALAQSAAYPAEDAVSFWLRFGGDVLASGLCAYAADHEEESVAVYGTAGSIATAFFRPGPLLLTTDRGTEPIDIPVPPHVHQPLIETVVAHLNGAGTCPSTGDTAIRTSRAAARILAPLTPSL